MSIRSYHDLVHVSVDVDTSELEQRLESLGGLDEDRVREIIAEEGTDEDKVQDIVRDLMHSEGEDFVQGVIDGGSYVTEYDVDQKIDNKIDDGNYANATDLELIGERVEALEAADKGDYDNIVERLDDLQNAGGSYEDRLKTLEDGLASLADRNRTALTFFDLLKQAMALLQR